MKYVMSFLLVLTGLLPSMPVQAESSGFAVVVLDIVARDCRHGMDSCHLLNDAYIRIVGDSETIETDTDPKGRVIVTMYVNTPVTIQIFLNNEVLREVQVSEDYSRFYADVDIDYLPDQLYLPYLGM